MVSINYDSIIKDICFNKPIKCNDIYIANVSNPTFIKLPKLNILTTGKNDRNCYELWYHIDLNTVEGTTLIKMLHGLDICALNEAEKKSGTWFGKSIKRERLEQLYIPPYNKDKNDNLYLKLNIENKTLLKRFELDHISEIKITGLEFYKNKFKYLIHIDNVSVASNIELESNIDFVKYLDKTSMNVDLDVESKVINDDMIDNLADTHEDDHEVQSLVEDTLEVQSVVEDADERQTVVIEDTLEVQSVEDADERQTVVVEDTLEVQSVVEDADERQTVVVEDTHEVQSVVEDADERQTVVIEDTHEVQSVIEDADERQTVVVEDTLEVQSVVEDADERQTVVVEDTLEVQSVIEDADERQMVIKDDEVQSNISNLSRAEIETMVSEKKDEVKKCFINAERASQVAENLRLKAIKKSNELKECEKILNNEYI